MATYETLQAAMDTRMLAADPSRVVLLRQVLHQLGDPDQAFKRIHLAGTNGKGSTGAWLAQALQNLGLSVGHFHSPAIESALGQTLLNGQAITATEYAATMTAIMHQVELTPGDFSAFEWDVLVSLRWYAAQAADWVVLEAGLGGAFDATNAISAPEFAVFTHIALDHTAILGPSVVAIAQNKAQIIKAGSRVVVAPSQAPEALAVLQQTAVAHHAASFTAVAKPASGSDQTWAGRDAEFAGHTFHLKMLGDFQLANAATAWTVWDQLGFDPNAMRQAMASVQLPGRMQVIAQSPMVVLDAGHNPDALPKAVATVRALLPTGGRLLMVAGFLKDKATAQLAQALSAADAVWVTTPDHPTRALSGQALQALVPGSQLAPDVHAGLVAARAIATAQDVILVAGSFYLIGDLLHE